MSIALTYSVAGMQAATDRVAIRAGNIANVLTPGYRAIGVDQEATASGPLVTPRHPAAPVEASAPNQTGPSAYAPALSPQAAASFFDNPSDVSLEHEIVDMTMAKHAYKASALVTKTAHDMQDALLDMFS